MSNRINILSNQNKKSEKSPDYYGFLEFEGFSYKIAGWTKKSDNDNRYINLTVNMDTKEKVKEYKPEKL